MELFSLLRTDFRWASKKHKVEQKTEILDPGEKPVFLFFEFWIPYETAFQGGQFHRVSYIVSDESTINGGGRIVEFGGLSDKLEPLVGGHDVKKVVREIGPKKRVGVQDAFLFELVSPDAEAFVEQSPETA